MADQIVEMCTFECVCKKCEKTFTYTKRGRRGAPRKFCPECKPGTGRPPSTMKLVSVEQVVEAAPEATTSNEG